MARGLKFRIFEVAGWYFLYSNYKGTDHAPLFPHNYAKSRFSHDIAQLLSYHFPVYSEHSPSVKKVQVFEKYFLSWIQIYDLVSTDFLSAYTIPFNIG